VIGTVIGLLGLYFIPAAQAVHDTGAFELDGNATNNPAVAGDDWDNVCHQVIGSDCSTTNNTTGATAVSFVTEANPNSSIFTGGGSKDPIDISSWAWKDAGGLPDKDNLQHGFAARYSLTPSATCPSGTATTCELLYFGSDRFDNSGDAQQGFWFFQNKITLGTTPNGGGTSFNGVHKNGDLLIISDFSNGGTTSTISVYKWDSAVSGNLSLLATSNQAGCVTAAAGDAFCGIVNPTNGTVAPWPFTDKSGNHTYLQGELYEGGVNLSQLGLGGECFSSVASETRSSTSTTATLKDFVLGQFAVCGATLSTTPSVGAGTEVSPGTSVTDIATVQGTGTATPPTPTGNVTFHMCGPIATGVCTTGGVLVSTNALAGSAPPPGEAQATSDAVNTGSGLLPGRYCFRADWPGDSNYAGPFTHAGTGNSECFVVRTIPTTTVTTPSDGSGTALTSPVALGTTLYDKAVVTGTAVGGNPPGTVDFFLCNPSQVTGAAGAEVCATGGTNLSGNPRTLVADANSSPPTSSVLSSPGVAAGTAGVWCFRAVYTPTGTTYTGSSDATHGECVTVSPETTTTVTTPSVGAGPVAVNTLVTDHAVVTAFDNADGTPTGTINFFICNPAQVTANGGTCSSGGTAAGSKTATAVASSNPPASEATSDQITATGVGTWCFRAEYVPGGTNGGNYTGSSDSSTAECFLVQDSTSILSNQKWLPNDTATVSATGGTALNGTLTFTLYESSDCSGTAVSGQTYPFTLSNASTTADRTKSTNNSTYLVTANKTVSWNVVFAPAAGSNVIGSSHCETSTVSVTN
jgi:hypothetical protein